MQYCYSASCDLNGLLNGARKMAYCLLNTPFFSVSIQWSLYVTQMFRQIWIPRKERDTQHDAMNMVATGQ
jgi:hypothetical protein